MIHLGNVPASTTIYVPFATYAGSTGASVTCTGLAVTDVEIYKNGSVTQRSSDAGIALLDTNGIDFDGITGLHGFSIDLSDNTDASFYAVGSWYWVVVSAITVDSQTVTFLAATFRIAPAESLTGHPKTDVGGWLGTAAATPTVAGVPEVDITHLLGTAWLTPGVAGTPDVNVKLISGDSVAADNLELACDNYSATRGLSGTALPAAAADAAGGLPISDAGGLDLDAKIGALTFTVAGDVDVNVQTWGGTAISTPPAVNASQFGGAAVTATTSVTIPAASTLATTTGAVGSVTSTVGSVTGSVGSVTGAVGSVTAVSAGAITSASFAAGAITAAGIATGAIDADALAADAVAEIADGVWDEDATGHQTQGTFGQAIGDPVADTNSIFKATVTDATGATVGLDVAAVLDDTGTDGVVVAAGSKTGYTLTATTGLGNQTADITGTITTVTTATNLTNAPTAGDLTATMKASVNAEVVDVLTTDTFAELGAVPAATSSLKDKLTYMFMWFRNKSTQTATTRILRNDADNATVATETVSDDATTYTKGEAS